MDNNVADGPEHIVVWEAAQQLADTDEVTSGHRQVSRQRGNLRSRPVSTINLQACVDQQRAHVPGGSKSEFRRACGQPRRA